MNSKSWRVNTLQATQDAAAAGTRASGKKDTRVHRIRIYREQIARARAAEHVFRELLNLELDLAKDELTDREAQSMVGGRAGACLTAGVRKLRTGEDQSDARRKAFGSL